MSRWAELSPIFWSHSEFHLSMAFGAHGRMLAHMCSLFPSQHDHALQRSDGRLANSGLGGSGMRAPNDIESGQQGPGHLFLDLK